MCVGVCVCELQNEAAVFFFLFFFFSRACVMLGLAAVSVPVIVPGHMTFTHATRANHPADIGDP